MRQAATAFKRWRQSGGTAVTSTSRLRDLQIIGALSALVFAFNFCFELFVIFSGDRSHQLLILSFQLCLAAWAMAEAALLHRRQPSMSLDWLALLLVIQFMLELARLVLSVWGRPFGIENSFGIFMGNFGPLTFLLPLYLLVFFGISKALMDIHAKELDKAWNQLTRAAVIESKQQEREQLLRDMHDGFGAQIATMRIMAEQGRLDAGLIPGYLAEISADLHLIVDTFQQAADVTLSSAIADFRYRLHQRLGSGATRLHWKIRLTPEPKLDSHAILSVLRILQESINNALHHASPENLWIEASVDPTMNLVRMSVRNDGLTMPEVVRRGRGLGNMETRARELSGQIQLNRLDPGLEVVLVIRADTAMKQDQKDGLPSP